MEKIFTDEELLGQLALLCYRAGGVRKWAKKNGCTHSSVSRMLKGTQPISKGIAKILEFEESGYWRLIEETTTKNW